MGGRMRAEEAEKKMTKRIEVARAPVPLEEYVKHFDRLFGKSNQREGFRQYLAACRRERNSSHANRYASARVDHGMGKGDSMQRGRRQNRVSAGDPTGWKDAPVPALRLG